MEGSRHLTIDVAYKQLLDRIKSDAYYAGESMKDGVVPNEKAALLQASSDDEAVLMDYIYESVGSLLPFLGCYLGRAYADVDATKTEGGQTVRMVRFDIDAVHNYDGDAIESLAGVIGDYMVAYAMREWSKAVPQYYQQYAAKWKEAEARLRSQCSLRVKPIFRTYER